MRYKHAVYTRQPCNSCLQGTTVVVRFLVGRLARRSVHKTWKSVPPPLLHTTREQNPVLNCHRSRSLIVTSSGDYHHEASKPESTCFVVKMRLLLWCRALPRLCAQHTWRLTCHARTLWIEPKKRGARLLQPTDLPQRHQPTKCTSNFEPTPATQPSDGL